MSNGDTGCPAACRGRHWKVPPWLGRFLFSRGGRRLKRTDGIEARPGHLFKVASKEAVQNKSSRFRSATPRMQGATTRDTGSIFQEEQRSSRGRPARKMDNFFSKASLPRIASRQPDRQYGEAAGETRALPPPPPARQRPRRAAFPLASVPTGRPARSSRCRASARPRRGLRVAPTAALAESTCPDVSRCSPVF